MANSNFTSGGDMLYLVQNDFDEKPRLVEASSSEDAVSRAKACTTTEQLMARQHDIAESIKRMEAVALEQNCDLVFEPLIEEPGLTIDDFCWVAQPVVFQDGVAELEL